MKQRINEPEIMDLGPNFYTIDEYRECLYQLGIIGKYFGTDKSMIKIFSKISAPIESILDVGCGGGSFAMQLAKIYTNAQIVGIDIDENAIDYAREISKNDLLKNLRFELRKKPELNEPEKSFDVITSTLVCHHLSDNDIIDFLKRAALVAKKNIIINDLHRHWFAYKSCSIIFPLFFKNRLILNDSLLSIRKSFIFDDWIYYLNKAGFDKKNYSINWYWPFRWIIQIKID